MPRDLDPAKITVGTGLAAEDSIEANALVHPTGGNDGLRVHILDPSRAHMASAIGIVDAGNYFYSDEVEGALQELAGASGASTVNGLIRGGGLTFVGLTATLETTTEVLTQGTLKDLSGVSVALIDNATQYVYYRWQVDQVITNLLPPTLVNEPVLFARVTVTAGVITNVEDARFFVPNIDRKPPFTLRGSGSESDANSEGCFESLTAAFLWLSVYGGSGGSNQVENQRILVRGSHTLTNTALLPIEGVILEGDGTAAFITGNALTPMFQLSGTDRVRFRNLLFVANHAGATAIEVADDDCMVEHCRFVSGLNTWNTAIRQTAGRRMVVRDCYAEVTNYGIRANNPDQVRIIDTQVDGPAGAGTVGIAIGESIPAVGAGVGRSIVRGCQVSGFLAAVTLYGNDQTVTDCVLSDCVTGVEAEGAGAYTRNNVRNTSIVLDSTGGLVGITSDQPLFTVDNCDIENKRVVYAGGEIVAGIQVRGASPKIRGCSVQSFYNTLDDTGRGIDTAGSAISTKIDSCLVAGSKFGIWVGAGANGSQVSGCTVNANETGINVTADRVVVDRCEVVTDITRGLNGIDLGTVSNCIVSNCIVRNIRVFAAFELPIGISAGQGGTNVLVTGCTVDGFYNSANNLGWPILADTDNVRVENCTIREGLLGIRVRALSGATKALISNCTITEVETGIAAECPGTSIADCTIVLDVDRGLYGVQASYIDPSIQGCNIKLPRTVWAVPTWPVGVSLFGGASGARVMDNTIQGFFNSSNSSGIAIALAPGLAACKVQDNWIEYTDRGVQIEDGTDDIMVSGNTISGSPTAVMRRGITASGAGGAAITRLTVSDNNITNCTAAGIRLSGQMHDVVVADNKIDNYLPSDPYNPTGVGIWVSVGGTIPCSQWSVTGNIVQRSSTGIIFLGSLAVPVLHLTLTGNTIHHCGFAQDLSGGVPDSFVGMGSKGIGLEFVGHAVVEANVIDRIGLQINDAGVEAFPDQGAPTQDVQSHGICLRNCDGVAVLGNTIRDTAAVNLGDNYGITVQQQSSGVPALTNFVTSNIQVNQNRLTWVSGLTGNGEGNNGILLTVSRGSDDSTTAHQMSLVTIDGNQVTTTRGTGIRVSAIEAATLLSVSVSNNTTAATCSGSNPAMAAITLSTEDDGTTDASNLIQFKVDGNVIQSSGAQGIQVRGERDGTVGQFSLNDNQVYGAQNDGIRISALSPATAVAFDHFTIHDNTLVNWGLTASGAQHGIEINDEGISASRLAHFSICGNTIQTTVALTGQSAGIRLRAQDLGFYYVRINDNTIGNTNAADLSSLLNAYGINITTATSATSATNIAELEISNNNIVTETQACCRILVDGVLGNLTMSENVFLANGDATNISPLVIDCDYTGPNPFIFDIYNPSWTIVGNQLGSGNSKSTGVHIGVSGGAKIRNWVISDNIMGNSAEDAFEIILDDANYGTSDPAVDMLQITDNTFINAVESGVLLSLGPVGAAYTYRLQGIAVRNNTFKNCGSGGFDPCINVSLWAKMYGLDVSGNMFYECLTGVDNDETGVIKLSLGAAASPAAVNIRADNNEFYDCGACAILVDDMPIASVFDLQNLSVSGNQVYSQTNTAIHLLLSAFSFVETVNINGNTINEVAGTDADFGISIDGPSAGTSYNIGIHDNQIKTSGDDSIYLSMPDTVDGLSVEGNGSGTSGSRGISLTLDDYVGVMVSGNHVSDPAGYGIYVRNATSSNNLNISDNYVGASSYALVVDANAGLTNLVVSANQLFGGSAGYGIWIDFESALSTVTVEGNTVYNFPDGLIELVGTTSTLSACSITGNSLSTCPYWGIALSMTSGDYEDISITGNTIRNFNQSGNTSTNYIYRTAIWVGTATGGLQNVSIGDNDIYNGSSGDNGCIGIYIGPYNAGVDTAFDCVSIVGNNIWTHPDATSSIGIVYDTGSSTWARQHTIVGNNIRGPRVTAQRLGSTAGTYSVVEHNTGRQGAGGGSFGAGGWGTWIGTTWTSGTNVANAANNAD